MFIVVVATLVVVAFWAFQELAFVICADTGH